MLDPVRIDGTTVIFDTPDGGHLLLHMDTLRDIVFNHPDVIALQEAFDGD